MQNNYDLHDHANPFTTENCEGYTQDDMARLNAEFTHRWNGWNVQEGLMFLYHNGALMGAEDAIKQFQHEVARR